METFYLCTFLILPTSIFASLKSWPPEERHENSDQLLCRTSDQLLSQSLDKSVNIQTIRSTNGRGTDCPPRCRCRRVTVDCSNDDYDNIPTISNNTLILEFNFNNLSALTNTTLSGVRQLICLSITSNLIATIHDGTFSGMIALLKLDLSRNPIVQLVDWVFSPLINLEVFTLSHIGPSNNATRFNVKSFVNASNVRKLNYDHNSLDRIPSFRYNSHAVFPKLQSLNLDFNRIVYLERESLVGLRSVESLTLNMNNIEELESRTFRDLPSLEKLQLRNNRLRKIHQDAFCSPTLAELDLSQNSKIKIDKIFDCCLNISVLLLSNCCKLDLVKVSFSKLTKLTRLDLSDNGISRLPRKGTDLFGNSSSRLNYLSLSRNPIRKLEATFFEEVAASLKNLLIADCEITSIEESSLPHRLWYGLEYVDMSANKYSCDCRMPWFRNWLNSNGTKKKFYKTDPNQYRCYAPADKEGVPLSNLTRVFDEQCFAILTDGWLIFIAVFIFSMSLSLTVGSVLHRFRWHVRYFIYMSKIRSKEDLQTDDSRHYVYDAFVIYCQTDVRWVKNELLKHLETRDNLRLCIHDRNWQLGADIAENIVASIESSRKSLLIVSNPFVLSNWCYFEMIMAQTRWIREDRDNLIVVLLEEIDDRNISPRLRLQLSRQTYIQWTDVGVGQDLFWARLKQALRRPSQSATRSRPSRAEAEAALLPSGRTHII